MSKKCLKDWRKLLTVQEKKPMKTMGDKVIAVLEGFAGKKSDV
jgi:hypothetical protein